MKINESREIDSLCWQMRQADWPRGRDRERIDQLFGGWPPYSPQEVEEDNRAVNVNFGEPITLAHDARSQFFNAFMKPGNYFTARTDYGPKHKRDKYGAIVTRKINRIMKRSINYFECFRSRFALDVLHGIGPAAWPDQDSWCPEDQAICDVGIPARTLLKMTNLPFFYIYRSFTQPELARITRSTKRDPGWNMPLVNACLDWLGTRTVELMGNNWTQYWAPEKISEAVKGDGGFFVGDQCPTIDTYDFYYLDDEGPEVGWKRRIILDSWSQPGAEPNWNPTRKVGAPWDLKENTFLYSSGANNVASKREQIVSFQFADLSAVAPFQYHTVRSLGYLLYSVCHLQNRLRCAVTEAVFENLLQMFRVKTMEDVQRALKMKLHGFAFIDDTLSPLPAQDRFQPNQGLIQLGLAENAGLIQKHASSYTQSGQFGQDRTEKTKFQVMAEVNASTQLVSAGLQQAYQYQNFEYMEILRRFMKPHSKDMDVNTFRAECLKEGVPAEVLVAEAWDTEPEQVMGAGNKTLEMAISQQLMEWRPLYNPTAQNDILRKATLSVTGDAKWSDALVPQEPVVSNTVHDTELAFGAIMSGAKVTPKPGLNAVEAAGVTIKQMADKVAEIMQQGGVGTPADVAGLVRAEQYAKGFIEQLAQDDKSKATVKKLNDILTKVMNEVKGMAQRQQEAAQQAAQRNGGGLDPKDAAKIQATQLTAQQKVQQMKESHALRTAQRKIQFEQQLKQDAAKTALELKKEAAQVALDLQAQAAKNRLAARKKE